MVDLTPAEKLLWPLAIRDNVDTEGKPDDMQVLISIPTALAPHTEPRFAGFTLGDLRRARAYALERLKEQ